MLNVNPTRQELLKLKKRLKTAKSGHSLLEDKLDSLMRKFLERINELKRCESNLQEKIPEILHDFLKSRNNLSPKQISNLLIHFPSLELEEEEKNIMGIDVKRFTAKNEEEIKETTLSNLAADPNLKKSKEKLLKIFDKLIKFASLERELKLLAEEIEQTRRRVNALEHVFIPEIEETKQYIDQKLEEQERHERTVLMKLKDQLS